MVHSEPDRRAVASRLDGIYVIVGPTHTRGRSVIEVAHAAIDGGACAIQLRDKTSSPTELLNVAERLRLLCTDAEVLLIVNDDPRMASQVGADGVHVGQSDVSVDMCRSVLNEPQIIGRSNATVDEVKESIQQGADYVAVGAMFQTSTKLDTRPAGLEILTAAVQAANVPVVAIGGINADNIGLIATAGADVACVASAVTSATDPKRATEELLHNFESARS